MFPSWARGMLVRAAILGSVCLGLVGAVWIVSGSLGQDPDNTTPSEPAKPLAKNTKVDQVEPGKPIKEIPKSEPESPVSVNEVKPITLNDAISLVEKAGMNRIVKAEKLGKGNDVQFSIEVQVQNGVRNRLKVDMDGIVGKAEKIAEPARTKSNRMKSLGQSGSKDVKLLSLNEAISLVEKAGKFAVVKGEKWGEGTITQFDLDVLGQKGEKTRLVVNATGKVIVEAVEPAKKTKGKTRER
jgi:hypothetical protein